MSALEESRKGRQDEAGRNGMSPRKRPLPPTLLNEDEAPPNKRIHTPTEEEKEAIIREKQYLYKRLLDEKNPVYMFPFLPISAPGISPVSPVYSFIQQQQQASASPLGPSPLPVQPQPKDTSPSSTAALNISGLPTPSGSSIGGLTPPRPTQMLTANFLKYPFSPPTPSSLSSLSLVSPWSNGSVNAGSTKVTKITTQDSPKLIEPKSSLKKATGIPPQSMVSTSTILSALSSNKPCFFPGQSPLNYLQHGSPVSPMMYLNSPYVSSIPSVNSSIPSVSSSSGCSSYSESAPGSAASLDHSYAPSEYHVGPRRPLIDKIVEEFDTQSESPSNSGRNTPIDVGVEDNTGLSNKVDGVILAQRLIASSGVGSSKENNGLSSRDNIPRHHLTPDIYHVENVTINPQSYVSHLVERPSSGVSSMSSSTSSRDSTPEPDNIKNHAHSSEMGNDLFCMVPGRLSLLSSTQKYKVGVEEVRRRLSHPECLNASVLGGILRRAKSKNGGHVLRQRLESIGVTLPPGRRKATDLSLFTSLVEGEALHLAKDFHRLCGNYFPCVDLAQIIASQHTGTPEAQDRISMVKATQLILNELQSMVNAVGPPNNISPNDPTNPYPGLVNFGLITHGFGNAAISASLSVVQTYLKQLLSYYEGKKPIQADSRYRYIDNRPPGALPSDTKPFSPASSISTSSSRLDNVSTSGQSRSGLFVCLKQEPSE